MRRDQSIAWLKLLGCKVPAAQSRSGWAVSDCPLGPWRHDKGQSSAEVFGVKDEPGDSFCNCFSCGWHGKQSDLILEMRQLNKAAFHAKYPFGELLQLIATAEETAELQGLDSPDIEEMLFGDKSKPHVFPEWWLQSFPRWDEVPFAKQYLTGRNVPASVAKALDLRTDTEQKRVCFPVRDFAGRLMGLHGRAIDDAVDPRYRMYLQAKRNNPQIWLGESWIDVSKPVVVVEGPFDLTSVYRVYRNVASPLFANPSEAKLLRMADAMDWITFFDRGVGGEAGRAKVSKVMTGSVVTHLIPPEGCKDPGVMSVEQLVQILSPLVTLDAFLLE